jgi:ribosomal-protein-alanine N-acetyltransferase
VYVIARAFWGLGYATEAATAVRDAALGSLGLTRLIALVDPDNAPSARVASKLGMRRERLTTRPGGRLMEMWALGSGHGHRSPTTFRSDIAPAESRRARP